MTPNPTRSIDPAIASVLSALPTSVPLTIDSLPEARTASQEMMAAIPRSEAIARTDYIAPGPIGAPDVPIRVHHPAGVIGSLPCVYSMHGGGYVLGSYDMDDHFFGWLCSRMNVVGVSVDYRLAPDTPFPGPLQDCYAGLRWVVANADQIGVDPNHIGIAGTSAGGGLAAALALLSRDRSELNIAFQLLIYPMLDDRAMTESSNWDVPIWDSTRNRFGWSSYLGDLHGTDDVPSYAAPARASNLEGLPPASIWVGSSDLFCDEDILYAQRLIDAGVSTELHVYPEAPHGFDGLAPDSALGRRCRREMCEWLAARTGTETIGSSD